MFGTLQRKASARAAKLHSIAAVMRGRGFEGGFNVGGVNYGFSYRPAKASIKDGWLELTGSFTLNDERKRRNVTNVRATLLAAQGGIGAAPPRDKQPPDVYTASANLPAVESTGSLSFSGSLYFKLSPLNGRALGVPADMSRVQFNARLSPRDDAERALQAAYSSIVDALYGKSRDASAASGAVADLNKLIAAT